MNAVLDFFNWPLFEAFGAPVTMLEVIAFLAGAACVYGLAKQYLWNWPVAIVNAAAFVFLFMNYGLYADAFLQLVFIGLSVYGWYYWTHKGLTAKNDVPVRRATKRENVWLYPLAAVAWLGVAYLLSYTNSTVLWFDAAILAMSLLAVFQQTKKIIDSWWVWIAVDVISIPLYFYKGLVLTGFLYIIFMLLCFKGLYEWNKALKFQRTLEIFNSKETVTH